MTPALLRVVVLIAACVALSLPGCAHLQRENFLHSRAAEITYAMPRDPLWSALKEMVEEKGFSSKEDPGSYTLETEWKEWNGTSRMAGQYVKYVAVVRTLPSGRSLVRFYRTIKSADGITTQAGGDLRWTMNPNAAAPLPMTGATNPTAGELLNPIVAGKAFTVASEERNDLKVGAAAAFAQRDLALEWELLTRVDPKAARDLERMADLEFGDARPAPVVGSRPAGPAASR